jgi:hypothetical protein
MRIDGLELCLAHERIGFGDHILDADRLIFVFFFPPQLHLLFLALIKVLVPAHPVII